jgi:hypothetical protein
VRPLMPARSHALAHEERNPSDVQARPRGSSRERHAARRCTQSIALNGASAGMATRRRSLD